MPILDDDVVIMCPSDLIGCDNRGTKGVRLGHLVLGEPVSDYYLAPRLGSLLKLHDLVNNKTKTLKIKIGVNRMASSITPTQVGNQNSNKGYTSEFTFADGTQFLRQR